MTGITWLHLSDWHEGAEKFNEDLTQFDRKKILEKLTEDIRDRIKISPELEKIDFIVFSGDLAYSGGKEDENEYARARKLFSEVLSATELNSDRLFIIPGNHDLNRGVIEDTILPYPPAIKGPLGSHNDFDTESKVKLWLENQDKLNSLLQPFSKLKNFVNQFNEKQKSPDFASTLILDDIGEKKVGLLGLNSALMAGRKNTAGQVADQGNLIIGEPQIDDGFEKIKDCDVRIAVMHHPLDWLHNDIDGKHVEQYFREFHFILCGHRHQSKAITAGGTQGKYLTIAAGATYSSRDYSNAYNFVYFDPDENRVKVYLRLWNDDLGRWINDPYLNEEGEVIYTGCYEFSPKSPESTKPVKKSPLSITPAHPESEEDNRSQAERQKRLDDHYKNLVKAINQGLVVPFLGSEINLINNPQRQISDPWEWDAKGDYPPTNLELAAYLDKEFNYLADIRCPLCDPKSPPGKPGDPNFPQGFPSQCPLHTRKITRLNLPHISQYFLNQDIRADKGALKEAINFIYNHSYQPNLLHKLIAILPRLMKNKRCDELGFSANPLIVTTCFDRTIENAFTKIFQPFYVVSYSGNSDNFVYQKWELVNRSGEKRISKTDSNVIKTPEDFQDKFSLKEAPVILRLYGPESWGIEEKGENFAIAEDHFIKYLDCKIRDKLPQKLWAKLTNNHLWFLGYSLSNWNLRIILNQIDYGQDPKNRQKSWWAVYEEPEILEEELWEINKVELFSHKSISSLRQYTNELANQMGIKDIEQTFSDFAKEVP